MKARKKKKVDPIFVAQRKQSQQSFDFVCSICSLIQPQILNCSLFSGSRCPLVGMPLPARQTELRQGLQSARCLMRKIYVTRTVHGRVFEGTLYRHNLPRCCFHSISSPALCGQLNHYDINLANGINRPEDTLTESTIYDLLSSTEILLVYPTIVIRVPELGTRFFQRLHV